MSKLQVLAANPEALEDPEVAQLLREADEILTANPLEAYAPHIKQASFHDFDGKVKVFIGGNRSGKTTGGVVDDLIQALDTHALPEHLKPYKKWHPPFKCRIVTPDFTRTMIAVEEAIRHWCPPAQLRGGGWDTAYEKTARILRFENGSFFEFMSFEQDINKFGGSARHRVHYDEEPPGETGERIREECAMRLADYDGDELFTFTPLLGLTWTFDELWENKGPKSAEDVWTSEVMRVVKVDMDDNPNLSEAGKQSALAKIPEAYRAARKGGNFTHFQGLVYDTFDVAKHVREPLGKKEIKGQQIQTVIDPGIYKTAVLWGAFTKDNSLTVFDELILEGQTPTRVAAVIRAKEKQWGIDHRSVLYLIDPTARNRDPGTGRELIDLYQEAGIPVIPAQNDVETGIFEVIDRLDRLKLVIARNCQNLLWERERYRKKQTPDGRFAVVKRNDHGMDTLRYLCMSRPLPLVLPGVQPPKRWVHGTAPPADYRRIQSETPPMGVMS